MRDEGLLDGIHCDRGLFWFEVLKFELVWMKFWLEDRSSGMKKEEFCKVGRNI